MSTSEENKQFVLTLYQTFGTGDKDKIASYFAPDAEWIAPERNGMAVALGQAAGWVGRDAVVRYLTGDIRRLFTTSKVELLTVVADGDYVVIEQSFDGTVCNGRPYKMIYCFIFVVRDGLIHQVRPYFDTALGFELIFGQEPPQKIF